MIQISMIDVNDFVQSVTFDDTVYKLHFSYNDVFKSWSMDIRDSQNNDIVRSIRIVPNFPLLSQYKRHFDIKGEMIATVTTNIQNISRNDFINGRASLVYVSEDELNAILEAAV